MDFLDFWMRWLLPERSKRWHFDVVLRDKGARGDDESIGEWKLKCCILYV